MRRALSIVAVCFIVLSCGVARRQAEPSRADIEANLADQVWAFAQGRPEGFTLDLATMTEPSEGVAVSYGETQGSNTRESILATAMLFARANAQKAVYVISSGKEIPVQPKLKVK